MNQKLVRGSIIGMALFLAACGMAQAAEEAAPSFDLDEIVVTSTKTPVSLRSAGANMSVVTAKNIEEKHYANVTEALRNVPGVEIQSTGSSGASSYPMINGSKDVLVLVDGKRMTRSYNDGSMPFDLSNIVGIDNIERIEVLKGSGSALYGSDAEAGVINIITKKGTEDKTVIDIATGSHGQKILDVMTSGSEGKLSWVVGYRHDHGKGYRAGNRTDNPNAPKGMRIDNSDYDKSAYNLRLDYDFDDRNSLTFNYQGNENQTGLYGGIDKYTKTINSRTDHSKDSSNSYDLAWKSQYSSRVDALLRLYHNNSHYNGYSGGVIDYSSRTTGIEYQVNAKLSDNNLLTAGLEYHKDELNGSTVEYKKKDSNMKSFYLQDQWKISKQVTLTPGVRYDKHSQFGSYTSPKIALNYKPGSKTDIYLSGGKFFKAPSIFQLYSYQDYGWGMIGKGNPDLKPEKGHSWEFGVNHQLDDDTALRFNVFDRRTTDKIKWITTDYMTYSGTYTNVNKEKAHGLEIALDKKFNETMSGSIAYDFVNAKMDKKDGKGFVRDGDVPRHTIKMSFNYNNKKVDAGVVGKFLGGREGNGNARYTESTFWTMDFNFNYKFNKNMTAYFVANNIFNQYYEDYASSYSYYPAKGRTFLLGMKYAF